MSRTAHLKLAPSMGSKTLGGRYLGMPALLPALSGHAVVLTAALDASVLNEGMVLVQDHEGCSRSLKHIRKIMYCV